MIDNGEVKGEQSTVRLVQDSAVIIHTKMAGVRNKPGGGSAAA
jgi:hypothetical protein